MANFVSDVTFLLVDHLLKLIVLKHNSSKQTYQFPTLLFCLVLCLDECLLYKQLLLELDVKLRHPFLANFSCIFLSEGTLAESKPWNRYLPRAVFSLMSDLINNFFDSEPVDCFLYRPFEFFGTKAE
jgi:hypothetical protein